MSGPGEPSSGGPGLRVVVADDQRVVREGLATIVAALAGVEVVATAADGAEAAAVISARLPEVKVVVLTTYADDESVLAALGAGAVGYLTKDAGRDDIGRALHAAVAGQGVLDRRVQDRLVEVIRRAGPAARRCSPTRSRSARPRCSA